MDTFDFFGNDKLCPYISTRVIIGSFKIEESLFLTPANRVYFAQFDKETVLRAFKIKKVYYGTDDIFLLVNIAGIGLKYVHYSWAGGNSSRRIFASPKDYKMGLPCSIWNTAKEFNFPKMAGKFGTLVEYGNVGWHKVERFGWIDNTCKSTLTHFLATFTFEEGCKVEIFDGSDKDFPYLTKESCLKHNRVEVFDFEDEVEPTKVEVEIIRTQRFVSAPNKSVDVETATKLGKFYGENHTKEGERYKVYVNGELRYEN